MHGPKDISISDFTYELPPEKIAQHPLEKRDDSKLLIYTKGAITQAKFSGISNVLPKDSLLVFNNTRVIKARLLFRSASGKNVEVFCLEPALSGTDLHSSLAVKGSTEWECFIGNLKAWKTGKLSMQFHGGILDAEISERLSDSFIVNFIWQPAELTFAEILETAGRVPLPPYMKRPADKEDSSRYQTIYATEEGSVAAPTAGLHFTDSVLKTLDENGIKTGTITLHVGAGTFKPVKSKTIAGHDMHSEIFSVSRGVIKSILNQDLKNIIAVGTTSLRTIESIYWYGVQLLNKNAVFGEEIHISQWEPYDRLQDIPANESLMAVLSEMEKRKAEIISGRTGVIIVPGYEFRVINGLITNFHQPQSTLLLLIAAFIGSDWKKVYDYALKNDFRFLSYGDSSIITR